MSQATNNYEGGVQGNTIATSDAGSGSAWDVVTLPAGTGSLTYDNTHVYNLLAGKYFCGTTSTTAHTQWSTATLGAITDAYGRFYVYMGAFPFNVNNQCGFFNTGTTRCRLVINTTGKLTVVDAAGVTQATSTNAIALNQWNRVEFHVTFSATVGFMEIKLFQNADSTTPTETLTSAATLNFGGASANEFRIGYGSNQTSRTQWIDNVVWGATSYPGPAATSSALVNTVPPTVTGTLTVGSTVTANPGTWTPTPSSFTYFWHRADDNIGTNLVEIGATGSTYTLDPADASKYIQVGVIPVP